MSGEIQVGIADMKIALSPQELISFALGSCVGICILDKARQVAGMAHIMLPSNSSGDINNIFKYADTGIPEMVRQMEAIGCLRSRMTAKIAGGARMFEMAGNSTLGNIGDRNVAAAREALRRLNIRLVSQDVGENYGRTIIFNSNTGDLTIKSFAKSIKVI
jgi:chemotaxis protein CheD